VKGPVSVSVPAPELWVASRAFDASFGVPYSVVDYDCVRCSWRPNRPLRLALDEVEVVLRPALARVQFPPLAEERVMDLGR